MKKLLELRSEFELGTGEVIHYKLLLLNRQTTCNVARVIEVVLD